MSADDDTTRTRDQAPGADDAERASYLAALDAAIGGLPHRLAVELRAGVMEELLGLEGAELRARIATLGDPVEVARAAALAGLEDGQHTHHDQTMRYGSTQSATSPGFPVASGQITGTTTPGPFQAEVRDSRPRALSETRGYAVAGLIAIGFGGLALPVIGWLVGCVLVATSQFWRTSEKVWAIAFPPLAILIATALSWFSDFTTADSGPENPLIAMPHASLILAPVIVAPLTAVWLLLRLRGRRSPEDA